MTKKIIWTAISCSIVLSLVLAACARQAAPATLPPAPPPATTSLADGESLYAQKCASCHGTNAEGTAVGPAVAGHSLATIKMQVRNPMGTMPALPPSQLSDNELEELAEYVTGLGSSKAPVQEWEKEATEKIHHWMALLAIKSDAPNDASHHLRDALTFIKQPEREAAMREALDLIAQGKLHDAEHEIEEMVGSESPSGVTMQRFHLILTQRAVEAEDAARVKHHLGHFMAQASEQQKAIAQEALELVEKNDFHEAMHEVEELLED